MPEGYRAGPKNRLTSSALELAQWRFPNERIAMDTLTQTNKQLLRTIFDALAKGDGKPFVDSLADDFTWTLTGTNAWSGTYRGKHEVRDKLLKPLFAQFETQYTNTATRIIGEGEFVV